MEGCGETGRCASFIEVSADISNHTRVLLPVTTSCLSWCRTEMCTCAYSVFSGEFDQFTHLGP